MVISGTKEWAEENYNISIGCSHDCRYCYARANALKWGHITKPSEWRTERLNQTKVKKGWRKRDGRIMFPTTHDITPPILGSCIETLRKMLEAGNEVLIVSKPHYKCIDELCKAIHPWRSQVMFRFTIGVMSPDILRYWEPNAPDFTERLECLKHVYRLTYRTSVSMEPLIEWGRVDEMVKVLGRWVNDAIWIGKMNRIRDRVKALDSRDRLMILKQEAAQTDKNVRAVYDRLTDPGFFDDQPPCQIKWKESIKKVVGLPLPQVAGLDQ